MSRYRSYLKSNNITLTSASGNYFELFYIVHSLWTNSWIMWVIYENFRKVDISCSKTLWCATSRLVQSQRTWWFWSSGTLSLRSNNLWPIFANWGSISQFTRASKRMEFLMIVMCVFLVNYFKHFRWNIIGLPNTSSRNLNFRISCKQ